MMNFIKVMDICGDEIRININNIVSYYYDKDRDNTVIFLINVRFRVPLEPEKLDELIEKAQQN